jgi:TonB family protein
LTKEVDLTILGDIARLILAQKKHNPSGVIRPPAYPGGKKGLDEFIKSNLKYPEEALNQRVQGTVSVDYDVDVFGNVNKVKLKHGIGYGCDEEALRLVELLKFSKRKYQGMHVVFHQNINIHFRLPAPPPPPEETTIRYNITIEQKKEGGSGYTYTIRL